MKSSRSTRWLPGRLAPNSLRILLLLWIALPVIVSLLGVSMIEIRGHERAMTQMVQQQADVVARSLSMLIEAHLEQHEGALLQLANAPDSRQLSATGLPPTGHPDFHVDFGVGVTRLPLTIPADTMPEWADHVTVAELVDAVGASQSPGIATLYDATLDQWLFVQAVPVYDASAADGGGERGEYVLVGAETIDALLTEHLLPSLDPALMNEVHLTTAEGETLFAHRTLEQMSHTTDANLHAGGTPEWVTAHDTVLSTGWQVIVYKNWHELVPPVLTFGNVALVIVGLAILLALLAAYFGLRYIAWPLQHLVQSATQIGAGNFAAIKQPVGGVAEIEELRQALADMTDQVHAVQQELQSYIGAITLGQEEERRRLARDLHDDTVQDLIALNQQVEKAGRDLVRDPAQAALRLQDLRQQVNTVINGLRRQIYTLRPLYLEDLGFVPALELLVQQTEQRHALQGTLVVTGDESLQPGLALQTSIFRVAQEALQNVTKHANATQVDLHLNLAHDVVSLAIHDNGRGFDAADRAYQLVQAGHFGLLGMKERAQLHHGTLDIHSQPGRGTTVTVRLPLNAPASSTPTSLPTPETSPTRE